MGIRLIISAIILLIVVFMVFGCSKGDSMGGNNGGGTGGGGGTNPCVGISAKFSADVLPIIQVKCQDAACHGSGSQNGPGELLTYAQISAAKDRIRTAISTGIMPKTGSLTTDQKNKIICWVDNGGLNN